MRCILAPFQKPRKATEGDEAGKESGKSRVCWYHSTCGRRIGTRGQEWKCGVLLGGLCLLMAGHSRKQHMDGWKRYWGSKIDRTLWCIVSIRVRRRGSVRFWWHKRKDEGLVGNFSTGPVAFEMSLRHPSRDYWVNNGIFRSEDQKWGLDRKWRFGSHRQIVPCWTNLKRI